jgi:Cupin domain
MPANSQLKRVNHMSRKGKISVCVVTGLVTVLVGTALALSSISFTIGTVASYDFGGFGPGYPVPGTIQIQAFTMKPGDTVPWHYHKGVSYVILKHGTLTEQHIVGPDQCASEGLTAGSAFVESPAQVHSVTNTGNDVAVIWWATIFPKSDGIVQFTPEFKSGGVYPVNPPNCN